VPLSKEILNKKMTSQHFSALLGLISLVHANRIFFGLKKKKNRIGFIWVAKLVGLERMKLQYFVPLISTSLRGLLLWICFSLIEIRKSKKKVVKAKPKYFVVMEGTLILWWFSIIASLLLVC